MFLESFWETNGYGPSVRDIGKAVGIAPSNVLYHLRVLAAAGTVKHTDHRSRTWRTDG